MPLDYYSLGEVRGGVGWGGGGVVADENTLQTLEVTSFDVSSSLDIEFFARLITA